MQEAGTCVLPLHPQIALLLLVGQGHPAGFCCVTLCSRSFCPPGSCFCQLLNPFPAPLLPCPPSQPSPAVQAVVSFPTSLMWVTCRSWGFECLPSTSVSLLKSIREYGKLGRSWHIIPVVGSSIGSRPCWGVSKTCWCFGSTGCACRCHCSSGNGTLLCKSPCAFARGSAILTFLSNECK